MTDTDQQIEARLRRLAQATDGIEARTNFTDRVMQAIANDGTSLMQTTPTPVGVLEQLALSWSRVLPLAATLAVVAVVLAFGVEPETDDAFTADYALVSSADLAYDDLDNAVNEGDSTW